MSELRLHYVTDRSDLVAKLQHYAAGSAASRWFPALTYTTVVGLSWLSAWLFYVRQGQDNLRYVVAGSLALLLTLFLPWLYRRYQDHFLGSVLADDKLRGLVGPVHLIADDQGIEERGSIATIRAAWDDVGGIDYRAGRTIVSVVPMLAVVIPDRAFADSADRDAFITLVKDRIARARR